MKKSLLAAALIAPFLTGCVIAVSDGEAETHWAGNDSSSWQHQHKKNREAIADLTMDSSYQSVLAQLKTPKALKASSKAPKAPKAPSKAPKAPSKAPPTQCFFFDRSTV